MDAQSVWEGDVRAAASRGDLALICGAGISSALSAGDGRATWIGLIRQAFTYLGSLSAQNRVEADQLSQLLDHGKPSAQILLACAEWVKGQFDQQAGGEYKAWLQRTVGSMSLSEGVLDPQFCGEMPLLTTNYDLLLEKLTGRLPLTWTDEDRIEEFHEAPHRFVFHLHGHFQAPRSVVFGGTDYGRLESARQSVRLLEPLAHSHTYLMAGFGAGLDDPNFTGFLRWFRENFEQWTKRVYVAMRRDGMPAETLQGKVAYLDYGEAYDQLPDYLERLMVVADAAPPETTTSEAQAGDCSIDSHRSAVTALLPGPVIAEAERQLGPLSELADFQRSVLQVAIDAVSSHGVGLVSAVTGSGKTTVSRVAMNSALGAGGSTMMILPTKALVAQEVGEWDSWITAWEVADRHIRVYGSSRDYPEHDSPVSKGRFEVAIAIYEKLGAYLVSGQKPLSNTRLLIVDELQTLVEDKERAAKLEGLLTMVRLMPRDSRPAILGLSATLSEASTAQLRAWMGVQSFGFVQSSLRPVALDTIVMDAVSARRQPDAHLLSLGQHEVTLPKPEEVRHGIARGLSSPELARLEVRRLSTGRLAVLLAESLLVADPSRKILVFAPGRTAAQDLALSLQRLLTKRMGAPSRQGNPWTEGRFKNETIGRDESAYRFNALRHSDLPLTDDVIRGLRQGVAYHSARLPAPHRRQLEREFRDPNGILRVLIATDTLAIGVNLPADAVIATSIAGFTSGGKRRLLTAAELDNKGGRAGRRGHISRDRGEFYILVPEQRDLEDVLDITAQGTRTLSTIEGVFERYVQSADRVPRIVGRIVDLDDVARLVLQILCADGFGRREEALQARVDAVLRGLLAAQDPAIALPSAQEVLERLRSLKLITTVKDKVKPSRLGAALGRSGLSLANAQALERLARLATQGAGDIDLLYNAFRSGEMHDVSAWVSMPSVAARHYPSLKESIITYALAYCAEGAQRREDCARLLEVSRHPLPAELVSAGSSVVSPELQAILNADVETLENRDATALLRAVVAYEWSKGVPAAELKARVSTAIKSEEVRPREQPVELKIHYSDVEQLCEQVAGVIRGASEVSFTSSGVDYSNRMRVLALQTETGLPAWLAPIAKMRMPQLHRNRLALLWRHEPVNTDWASILDLDPLGSHPGLSDSDRADARRQLEVREQRERLYRHRVNQEWASQTIPGLAATFDEIGEELDGAPSASAYLGVLNEVASALGIDPGEVLEDGAFATSSWRSGALSVMFFVPEEHLDGETVAYVRETDCIVILRTRLRPTAYQSLAAGGNKAKFAQPEQLLSLMARFIEARGEAVAGEEVIEALLSIKVSALDSDGWSLFTDQEGAPPPFTGDLPDLPDKDVLVASEDEAP